jgi:hypothetical protein
VRLTFGKGDNASDPEWMNEWKRGDGGWLGLSERVQVGLMIK